MNAPSFFVKKKRKPWNEHNETEDKKSGWKQRRTTKGEAKRKVKYIEKES